MRATGAAHKLPLLFNTVLKYEVILLFFYVLHVTKTQYSRLLVSKNRVYEHPPLQKNLSQYKNFAFTVICTG